MVVAMLAVNATAQPELATPRSPVAKDCGEWGSSTKIEMMDFVNPPERPQWNNFYDSSAGIEVWHPQHVIRLANKNGHAYFMVSQSREHNGYITVLKTDLGVLDPSTDLLVVKNEATPIGKYVWQDVFTGKKNGTINPIGNWNHPGKMDVLGDVVVVAAQNWNHGSQGTSIDKILFYDVRDPEHPKYWGAIDKAELGVKEIATVGLARTPDNTYLLCAGGDETYATLSARQISPHFKDWTKIATNVFSGQHGMNFNSQQTTTKLGGNTAPAGQERLLYFDASHDSLTFSDFYYDPAAAALKNGGSRTIPKDLPGAKRDWDTSSLYVTRNGTPIIYTVKSGDWKPFRLYQVHNP